MHFERTTGLKTLARAANPTGPNIEYYSTIGVVPDESDDMIRMTVSCVCASCMCVRALCVSMSVYMCVASLC